MIGRMRRPNGFNISEQKMDSLHCEISEKKVAMLKALIRVLVFLISFLPPATFFRLANIIPRVRCRKKDVF